ncbi:hypothetical protein ACM7KB_29970 [Pseudomonas aeruginosa]|uniref:hypothetical protein n=1 Tax=Pseudomonas aeruginosa TaxID=287 RepID=UPI0021E99973|nr:hypothetical protein [Pseudomonas aeruginosa]MCV3851650.1 hypothetical protein [Pseudomonas aeruginosa]MCV3857681.1 hypothetical protein [Pseudomonas aeruginosa]MDY1128512.1 hypothetical protein [Pseudomonas aeruginosa]HCK4428435.1 hypothetical protein [Pseudomonas aeruginosa]
MGLRDEIHADIATAFDTDLADAVKPFTGVRKVQGEYDPETGGPSETTITYSGRGVFGRYKASEIDGSLIKTFDTKLLVLQAELSETPKVGDLINDYRALNVSEDPASVTWTIQMRK